MNMHPTVILLHGLWMGSWQLALLARRLRGAGFEVKTFRYASVLARFSTNLRKLHRFALAQQASELHFVGHSLGGLLAARLLHEHGAKLPPGRIVTLGTPLRGSATARRAQRFGLGTLVLGFAEQVLTTPGFESWTSPRQLGAIAGRAPFGLSLLVGGLAGPHDGSVAVSETRIDGLADHAVIGASHTSMLFAGEAARLTARFLRAGSFTGADARH